MEENVKNFKCQSCVCLGENSQYAFKKKKAQEERENISVLD